MTVARVLAALAVLWIAVAAPIPAAAQLPPGVRISSGVQPQEVTVGDPFVVRIQVDAPADAVVEFVEEIGGSDAVQSLAPVAVMPGDAGDPHVADFAMVAWRTGVLERPVVPVFVRTADGVEHVLRVTIPLPGVASVLPTDTVGVEPRPAKGVIDGDRAFAWWWLVLAALLLIVAAVVVWRVFARRRGPEPVHPVGTPRERAIAELDEARALGMLERGEWKPFYSRVSEALRRYLATISPGLGADLTTRELVEAANRDGIAFEHVARMHAVLREADLVKFARLNPSAADAEDAWAEARRLVESVDAGDTAVAGVGAGDERVAAGGDGGGGGGPR